MPIEDTLKKLVEADSVSGFEENVRDLIFKQLKPYADEIKVDKIGNIIAKKGKGNPVTMLAAHMDHIGLIVKYIEKEGFIRFDTLGGWDERIMLAEKVDVYGSKGPLTGVIGCKPPHLMEKEETKQVVKVKDMFIDIGGKDQKSVEKAGISVGDFIRFHGEFNKLLDGKLTGQGLDNRVGCLVMIEAFKKLRNFRGTLYAVGTVMEEMGLVGIRGSTFGIDPDFVIALDTTMGGDIPGVTPNEQPIKLGDGPVINIKDYMIVSNPQVRKLLKETAKKNKIKYQLEVMKGGASDASIVPMMRNGIPSGTILVPTRYIHSPVEVIEEKDIENAIKLTIETVKEAHKYF